MKTIIRLFKTTQIITQHGSIHLPLAGMAQDVKAHDRDETFVGRSDVCLSVTVVIQA